MSKAQLYQKMLAVMEAIDYLQKDDNVKFGSTNYKAISEEKVTSTVRAELVKNKLIVFPVEQAHSREGTLSTVDVKYKIVDTETGEYEILVSSGTGADTQDKGVGKAMTYAFKYLFLRTFAIPTGEDPDKTSSAELDAKEQQEKKQQDKKPPAALKAKWKVLNGGKVDGFEKWVTQMLSNGHDYQVMERALIKKMEEKKNAQ
ncbi:ERF family protein [Paenibacillus larvae]|uniref:ERF superfamily protein n=1 Tax=Paenibacillus larvae subsp. larvae TaxID=147375 RepID=A0A6C0QQL2_9BACL|nr:ERF family protein [Paenibacillus larvae]QHZ50674.1 ERF superfamily protein [Paenibacillus larvae subsp. larvae]QHZ50887.1 ERF superfamily protein [Paenibacillus larvae subsp. larvae]